MMLYLPSLIVNRINSIARWVVWAVFICLGSLANQSYAQNCTKNQTLSQATPLDSNYLLSSSARVRTIFKTELIQVMDCTSFPLNRDIQLMNTGVDLAMLRSTVEVTSKFPYTAKVTFQLRCSFPGVCFDSAGKDLADSGGNLISGIDGTLEIFYSGLDSQGKQCFTVTERDPTQGVSNDFQFALSPSVIATSTCQRVIMRSILTVQQTGVFYKPNVQTIKWKSVSSSDFAHAINAFTSGTSIRQSLTLNIQTGTCAIGLSNNSLSFGVLKTSQINALANGGVAKTLPFSLNIGSCIGTSLGKNKMLRWIFDDPRLGDFTKMDNSPFGSAKGISAQIIADAKFDSSGNAMASNIITNGEKYMASGKTADVQTLNYKVNIIRNSDAVVEGTFSSKATVFMDYQ